MNSTIKSMVIGMVSTVFLINVLGCATAGTDFAEMISEGSEVRTYELFGMDCPGCHSGLENLINEIPGVRTSKANWEKRRLKVVLHPNVEVNDDAIFDAIKRANFTPGKRLN